MTGLHQFDMPKHRASRTPRGPGLRHGIKPYANIEFKKKKKKFNGNIRNNRNWIKEFVNRIKETRQLLPLLFLLFFHPRPTSPSSFSCLARVVTPIRAFLLSPQIPSPPRVVGFPTVLCGSGIPVCLISLFCVATSTVVPSP